MLLGGVCSSTVVAQTSDSICWKDYSFIKRSQSWLTSENAAGLRALPVSHVSIAEVYSHKQNGALANYYQSNNSLEFGAQTESFYRLNPKTVFFGKVSYSNFSGKNMAGSVFIHPEEAPFDIVEYSDDNRGDKKRETYHLIGAVGTDLTERLTLGGKIDYTSSNYAKQKDLRHVNKLLDMNVTAGLSYRLNGMIELGANYYYRRSVEGLDMEMYGTTDKVYTSLISYGGFFGLTEQFGVNGYTKENEEKPLFNEYHGGALQLMLHFTPQLSLFNEFAYKTRDGYYGKKSPSAVVYSNHDSNILEYHGRLSLKKRKNLHTLNLDIRREELSNKENIYRVETASGGSSNIGYYGTLDTTDKTMWNARAEYNGNLGVTDFCPAWLVKAAVDYSSRSLTASVYPYYRKQEIKRTAFLLSGERAIRSRKDMYSLSLGTAYSYGSGTAKEDGIYATPSETQSAPKSMDEYLYREYEYLTGKQIKGEAGFKYSRMIGDKSTQGYVSLRYSMLKAFDVKYLGDGQRHDIQLTIGCIF